MFSANILARPHRQGAKMAGSSPSGSIGQRLNIDVIQPKNITSKFGLSETHLDPHRTKDFENPSREDANHVLHYTSEQVRQNNDRMV